MKILIAFTLFCAISLVCFVSTDAHQTDYASLKSEAEKFYAAGSYGKAHELYIRADALELPAADARWVDFRVADTLWRADAATENPDSTKRDQSRGQLEYLIGSIEREEDRDLVWAEAQESLGDLWWMRKDSRNWGTGWRYYHQSLDWWAGSPDLEIARDRYLKIVWKIVKPAWVDPYYYYGYYGNFIPVEVLDNALRIARTEDDRVHAQYLIAMTLKAQGPQWNQYRRVPEAFEAAISVGKETEWYDDALYHYADWMMSYGRMIKLESGQLQNEPDFVKALDLYRKLIREHVKGETRYYDHAQERIKEITGDSVGIGVSNIFLPDSEIQFHLNWRNVKRVEISLYKIDLTRDVHFPQKNDGSGSWLDFINISGAERVKYWTKETDDKGDHKPGHRNVRVEGKLPIGAYLVEARTGNVKAREVILVSDATVIVKTAKKQALVYACSAMDGSPIAGANVKLWEHFYNGNEWHWREHTRVADQQGIAIFDLSTSQSSSNIFASASMGDRQAFSPGYVNNYSSESQLWKIYALTDRPAYRPDETAQWKFIARKSEAGSYSTPAGQTIEFEITDPKGTKVKEGKAALNSFGSAWGSMEITDKMPLGQYQIAFWNEGRKAHIGNAVLFRIEEYKLPEFKVAVSTPEENGRKKAFRLGEKVEVQIQTDYYFGGSVANATVEVLVYQNYFYQWWQPERDYPWYYEHLSPARYGGRQGQIIKREKIKTDSTGKAVLTFDTPQNIHQDFEYYIEARVRDSSRREVTGTGNVRVTRQRYYVYPRADHNIYRPKDKVDIRLKALDANDQPVEAEGRVRVTRDYWYEVWLSPDGREVKGEELKRLRERSRVFPPAAGQGARGWQLKFAGYEHDEVLAQTVKTDASGEAELSFTPEREGYYKVAWRSADKDDGEIRAETAVWVGTNATTELGYRTGGAGIIIDKETFRAGQKAPVMLFTPTSNRYVLLSVEGEDLYSYQLVHITGTAKLIELEVEDKHVPNIFLSAAMVSDRQIFFDTKEVVVPPVDHFLSIDVKPDRDDYEPRQEGTLNITARDHQGKPVAAEVALGLVDESVYYIQQDYAADPRRFYYGTKRQQQVQTQSSFQQKAYARLVEDKKDQLIDDRYVEQRRDGSFDGIGPGQAGGVGSGFGTGGKESGFERLQLMADLQRPPAVSRDAASNRAINGQEFDSLARRSSGAVSELKVSELGKNEVLAGGKEPAVQVRNDFRSTILWMPDVVTDRNGKATVKVKYPDSLTGWKATARAVTSSSQFGMANTGTRTWKPLIVRLQAPRFFVTGDKTVVSAVINNNTDKPMSVSPSINAEGVIVAGLFQNGSPVKGESGPIEVPAKGEKRVDWLVLTEQTGYPKLKVTARGGQYADAMERSFVAHEHGIEKYIAKSGKMRGDSVRVRLDIPKERKAGTTTMTVQVAPSLAVTMLDALPYLIDYPYGCTEQTMSRFLPAAITAKTLKDLGLKPESVMGKLFGGIEREYANKTHTNNQQDLRKLDDMVTKGLARLYDFQHSDGGWGWWKDGESDHFMTAYVVWGMTLARDAGIEIKADVLEGGARFLDQEIVEEEANYDIQSWMLHALASYHRLTKRSEVERFQAKAFENLWTNRDRLNAYTRALLALSAHNFGYADRARILIDNLENGVKIDATHDSAIIESSNAHAAQMQTARWGEDGVYWRWSEGGVEATAFALRALLAIDPKNKLVEPVTNWLIKNRRGAQWSNTRDTAITVLAMNEYLRQSGELASDAEYELIVNDQPVVSKKLTSEDVLSAPSRFAIDAKFIRDGANEIRINRKGGAGALYFAASAEFFSLEEPVQAAGNEIFVRRDYYRLVSKPTLLKGYVYEKRLLGDGDVVASGDRIEAVITIEAKNNYEYLLFEDLKPAGLEAAQIRSGESVYARELKSGAVIRRFAEKPDAPIAGALMQSKASSSKARGSAGFNADYTGRSQRVYQELRDRKVALFIDKLPQGVWEIRYEMRAESPGLFHALPVLGHAMYVPEIRCNGSEMRIKVEDSKVD